MKVYRRRKKAGKKKTARKNPSAKRKAAAKKAAATRKRKAAARSAAAKKAARTRKRNLSKKKTARRTVRKKASRRNPVRRRRKKAVRRNPSKAGARPRSYKQELQAQASALGVTNVSKKTIAQLERALKAKGKKKRKKRKTTKRRKLSKNMRYARQQRKRKVTKKITRGKNKGSKRKVASSSARVSKAYLKTKRLQKAIKKGKIKGGASKMATAMGLTRVNPASSVLKDFTNTAKALAIPAVASVVGLYGLSWVGMKLSAKIAEFDKDKKMPKMLAENIVPITTATASLGAAMALRRYVKKKLPVIKMDGAQLAPWIAVGGLGATLLMVMATTKWGKDLTAKLGFTVKIDQLALAEKAAEGSAQSTDGLGSYITVSQYLGAYGVDIDPMGPSWYGRSDISPVGDYVDAGPQNMFGGYVASDFPVHAPGPGDNQYTMATLGEYADSYGQEGMFASGMGDLELEETPGGTMITMGEAGIFGGKGVL